MHRLQLFNLITFFNPNKVNFLIQLNLEHLSCNCSIEYCIHTVHDRAHARRQGFNSHSSKGYNTCIYEVWSESNAQGEITFILIIFKTPLFWDFLGLIPASLDGLNTAELQQQTHFWRPHPSLSWSSPGTTRRQPAVTSLSNTETRPLGHYLIEWIADRFYAFASFWSPEAAAWTWTSSHYRDQSWDDNLGLLGVKITRDLARAFLKHTTLMHTTPPKFLNFGSDINHDVGGPLCHFWRFSSLKDLLKEFRQFHDIFLFLYLFSINDFFHAKFLQPLRARWQKWAPPPQLRPPFDRLCWLYSWSELVTLWSFFTENSNTCGYCFYRTSLACYVLKIFCPAHLYLITRRKYQYFSIT